MFETRKGCTQTILDLPDSITFARYHIHSDCQKAQKAFGQIGNGKSSQTIVVWLTVCVCVCVNHHEISSVFFCIDQGQIFFPFFFLVLILFKINTIFLGK